MNYENFNDFLTTQLNNPQRLAVAHKEGSLLVIAGAGTGKTRVITTRILNLLIKEHVDPRTIIALTFTNKAAHEMKERINSFIQGSVKPFIGTFHSYCLQLLKTNPHLLEYSNFSILDSDDQQQLLTNLIKKSGLEKRISARNLAYQLSIYKNNAINSATEGLFTDPIIKELLIEYEREKKLSKCFDFDDLLLEVLQIFKKYPEFKASHQANIRHILVDEYQDTNVTQHELLKAMSLANSNFAIDSLCAVGDEDQSIYSWRGATIANMLNFQKDFHNTLTIKMEENYRSALPILDTANAVIKHNTQRNPKQLWSAKVAHDRVRILQCLSGYQEGEVIAHLAKQVHASKTPQTIAVLYRAHYQSRTLEEAFIRNSIGYKIIGGIQFYERKEIKDLLAYLRAIANPFDRISLFRIINCPLRGLGDKFQEQLHELWDQQPFSTFMDCIQSLIQAGAVTGMKKNTLESFLAIFKTKTGYDTPRQTLETLIQEIQYFSYLQSNFEKAEAESKIDNVKELLRAANHLEQNGITTIEQFLQHVALMQEKSAINNEEQTVITLMTLHAAKGLEFEVVVLAGLEEGLFPSQRSSHDTNALEEERRLFYVGITRAKERLLLTYARYRHTFGSMTDQIRSRFLSEVPEQIVSFFETTYWHDAQLVSFCSEWLGIRTRPSEVVTFGAKTSFAKETKVSEPLTPSPSFSAWKRNQPVKHPKFGVGTIQNIESRDDKTFVTVTFKSGTKKIDSSFIVTI
jgi:DNA helicase II / ATP-dependent DNA helicase PcrA